LDDRHLPVLVAETLAALEPERGGLYVDATVGLGGHAEAILAAAPAARLLGIDRDPEALALAARRLAGFGDRLRLAQGTFDQLPAIVGGLAEPAEPFAARPAGILADLGVSSLQLDRPERGFSFRFDGPLDMRMGGGGQTAADIVNHSSEAELTDILREYGEEWQARRIARTLVLARREKPLETTADLRAVIDRAKGGRREREGRVDPATRVFQALRIAVNDELAGLERFLDQAVQLLDGDGRLVIISYHSLEDRIVKHRLRDLARGEADPVTGRPRAESRLLELLTRKPLRPSEAEVAWNPRSRSARLRAARRV
jgi:16S rRNA (cytosine1402-N4)-methyltransferase